MNAVKLKKLWLGLEQMELYCNLFNLFFFGGGGVREPYSDAGEEPKLKYI